MQLINAPGKLVLPFANAGAKNAIPVASQIGIVAGAASLTDGFPPLTRTPLAAGGVPPSGLDMNGIIYELSAILRWANAGAGYVYDGTFASDSNVGGYPKGARVLRSDGLGYWLNTVENNVTDPENATAGVAAAAGWVPDLTNGVAAVTMTSANVTLTPAQYGKPIIVISGLLTANLNLIFPTGIVGEWTVVNNTTGAYSITCKTAAGTGVVVIQSAASIVYGDATNIGGLIYAPLASPAFTGNPTAPTPARFDNDTSVATTAFVKQAGLVMSAFFSYASGATIPVSAVGAPIQLAQATSQAYIVPLASSCPSGSVLYFANTGAGAALVARSGSDTFGAGSGAVTGITILTGEQLMLVSNGIDQWFAIGGSASFLFSAGFNSQKAASGFQRLPSGLFIQWGAINSVPSGSSVSVSYPVAFPNEVFSVLMTPSVSGNIGVGYGYGANPTSLSAFTAYSFAASGNLSYRYIAIGN